MRNMMATLTAALIFVLLPGSASAAYGAAGLWRLAGASGPVHARTQAQSGIQAQDHMPTQSPVQSSTSSAQALLTLLNSERSTHGLKPLVMDAALTSLAQAKSEDMNNNRYFNHTSPTYGAPSQMLQHAGIRYTTFGENIAQGSSPDQIHTMWLNSPAHRANMLNPNFTSVGIGVAAGNSGLSATELFIAR